MKPPVPMTYSMPAEWAPHEATWLAWPSDDELWLGYLAPVRDEFASLVSAIAKHERVELFVKDEESEKDAKARLKGNIRFHRTPYDDVWLRDSGPIFLLDNSGSFILSDWEFNGWGNKYAAQRDNDIPKAVETIVAGARLGTGIVMEGGSLEVNGAGAVITTEQCLLSPERNPNLTKVDFEEIFARYLGTSNTIWLREGLENDHTDGHIDTLTRFADETTIITSVTNDTTDPNFKAMSENREVILAARDQNGVPFRVVDLPLPLGRLELEGARLAASYANFYICNGAVIVPQYGDVNDEVALSILRPLFPNHAVIGLSSRALITGGGSFHCVTQQQPAGALRRVL